MQRHGVSCRNLLMQRFIDGRAMWMHGGQERSHMVSKWEDFKVRRSCAFEGKEIKPKYKLVVITIFPQFPKTTIPNYITSRIPQNIYEFKIIYVEKKLIIDCPRSCLLSNNGQKESALLEFLQGTLLQDPSLLIFHLPWLPLVEGDEVFEGFPYMVIWVYIYNSQIVEVCNKARLR